MFATALKAICSGFLMFLASKCCNLGVLWSRDVRMSLLKPKETIWKRQKIAGKIHTISWDALSKKSLQKLVNTVSVLRYLEFWELNLMIVAFLPISFLRQTCLYLTSVLIRWRGETVSMQNSSAICNAETSSTSFLGEMKPFLKKVVKEKCSI